MTHELVETGYYPVPAGRIAAVVTFLEMRSRPPVRPVRPPPGVSLVHEAEPDPDAYLDLYRRIGAPWLWFSRLAMERAQLVTLLTDPRIEVHVVRQGEDAIGLVELDRRQPGEVELAFFGVVPEQIGRGLGRWMMERAIDLAFARGTARFWVHTCTLDHPGALEFYLRSGFRAYRRAVEVADDPRLLGILPRGAAPHVPLIEPA